MSLTAIDYAKERLTLIYLDQCAVSNLLDQPRNASWNEIRDLLLQGCQSRRFLCPYSLEHLVETAAMTDKDASEADLLLRRLSLGQSLRLEFHLIAAQVSSSVRGVAMPLTDLLEPNRFRSLSDSSFRESMQRRKVGLDSYNSKKLEAQNYLNSAFRDGLGPRPGTRQAMSRVINESYSKRLLAELDVVRRTGRTRIVPTPDAQHMPEWPSMIVSSLVTDYHFGAPELSEFGARIRAEGVMFIPFFQVKIALESAARVKHQNIEPRDQYDVTRISCALPFADILITDGGLAGEIREVSLDTQFATDVFSTKSFDREAIVRRLRNAIEATSPW